LVVGDAIYDEYCYVKPLGMAAKEPILAVRAERTQRFRGGVWAAAEHVKALCGSVHVEHSGVVTVKTRFVEETYVRKLFEVHRNEAVVASWGDAHQEYDLVIAADFGHGDIMSDGEFHGAKFLAVNAQTNSANRGFNLITKYKKADYVVIDSMEARLAAQDRDSEIENVIEKLGFQKIVVTLGADGAVGYDGRFHYSKAKTKSVVDSMGAGDAFFCVTAPLAAVGADMQTILEVGNAAGAIKCGSVGQKAVTKEALCQIIEG
jgi:bifunctional ADP-heptose synthase (sugar kinase/adenylyltransferase)